jgi:hypothetical protein
MQETHHEFQYFLATWRAEPIVVILSRRELTKERQAVEKTRDIAYAGANTCSDHHAL